MKKIVLTFFLIFLSCCNLACSQKRVSHLKEMELKGNVLSVMVAYFDFADTDGVLRKKEINPEEKKERKIPYLQSFKKSGFLQELIHYYDSTKIDTSKYKYDEQGFLVQIQSNWETSKIKCNEFGNVVERDDYPEVFRVEYDSKGRVVNQRFFYFDKIMLEVKFFYKNNRLIKKKCYGEGGKYDGKTEFRYLPDSGKIHEYCYTAENELDVKIVWQEDSMSNPVDVLFFNSEDSIIKQETFVYEYDMNGNWIKKYCYLDGKPELFTERTIVYYQE